MTTAIPSIACLGVIGRNNNPLHISIFPSHDPATNTFSPIRTPLQFSLLLSSTIDIFELRAKSNAVSNVGLSGDLGLLHAVDDRLAAYGYETNTGVKMVCVVDMRGRTVDGRVTTTGGGHGSATGGSGAAGVGQQGGSVGAGQGARRAERGIGLRDTEVKPVFRAMQNAYVRLLQNPFYEPDEHNPTAAPAAAGGGGGGGMKRITSRRFGEDMKRIGEAWTPGVTSF